MSTGHDVPEDRSSAHCQSMQVLLKIGEKRQLSPFESIYATAVRCTYMCSLILTFRMSQMMLGFFFFSQLMPTGKVS